MADNQHRQPILPGSTIGILGGGQLGRMMALEAIGMGYRIVSLDPQKGSPCGQVAAQEFVAPFDDLEMAEAMSRASDVVTYEFENVSSEVVRRLQMSVYLPQGADILQVTQHRLREKERVSRCGVSVAPYRRVTSLDELRQAATHIGLPAVLKTTQGGYDGKGQSVIRREEQMEEAFTSLTALHPELILEAFIPFAQEISVIAARNPAGDVASFPVAENVHEENILRLSIAPARIPPTVESQARRIAERLATELQIVGLLAVEMFLTSEGEIYVNELAPRPHNSGHFTQDACVTSQFEQHIRAICNLPLGSTQLLTPVVMLNLLGEEQEAALHHLGELPRVAKLHLYGKGESRPRRKMGHLNFLASDVEEALQDATEFRQKALRG